MKKIVKVLSLLAFSVVLCLGIVAFAACSEDDKGTAYTGEYHYNSHNTEYGMKVEVTVKDEAVTKVKVLKSDYVACSNVNPDYGWTQENVDSWNNGLGGLLTKYNGKTVKELLAINVAVTSYVPDNGQTFEGLVITGATQGSGRLLLAVQNALAKCPVSYTGEYHYNSHNTEYGMKVKVNVTGGKIDSVKVLKSDYVACSNVNPDYGWTQENVDSWNNGLNGLLAKYKGKTVAEILAIDVAVTSYVPDGGQTFEGLVITGATQGSGRLLLAVQNALGK